VIDMLPMRGHDLDNERIAAVVRVIERMKDELGHPLPLAELATTGLYSPFHFHRLFRDVTTLTPARFLAALRMAEARRLLLHSRLTVTAIGVRVGYQSAGTFTRQFTRLVGLPPRRFRELVRRLADETVAGLLPMVSQIPRPVERDAIVVQPRTTGPDRLVLAGLQAIDGMDPATDAWAVTAGRHPVPLATAPEPGAYQARMLVVESRATPTDALVDNLPGSYVTGMATVRLTRRGWQNTPVSIRLRPPRPTDPPILTVAPLRRLAALVT
jgi:AraC family transcriptional regulator